jgi:hypothetical protein
MYITRRGYILQVSEDFLKSGGREAKAGVEIKSIKSNRFTIVLGGLIDHSHGKNLYLHPQPFVRDMP